MTETNHPHAAGNRDPRYPLGADPQELDRLRYQHRLWADAAHALWSRAGIAPGSRVLDVGAGPGAASFDLAQMVTAKGRVVAVDASPEFVAHVTAEARARGVDNLIAAAGDVQDLAAVPAAPAASFDLAYARWVLCFTPRPEDVVRGVASRLAPGGALCVHDYFNYEAMTPAPRRASYAKVVAAGARSWRDAGGDPDVVARLPRLVHEAGLTLEHLAVHQRIARPGDTMFHWATTWWRTYTPKLVAMGYVTAEDEALLLADLDAMTREHDFLVLPPVFELIARRS